VRAIIVAALIGAVVAATVFIGATFLVVLSGGTECYKTRCHAIGELMNDHPVLWVACTLGVSLALGWFTARRWWRRF
jgi:hypothetical protein